MTGGEIAGIITSIASLIAAIGSTVAVIGTVINGRKIDHNSNRIEEVHLATNGMKEELVKVTGEKAYAEGIKEGQSMKVVAVVNAERN